VRKCQDPARGYRLIAILAAQISRELNTLRSRASKTTPGILGPEKFAESANFEAEDIESPSSVLAVAELYRRLMR
jgi:hypothetical protein